MGRMFKAVRISVLLFILFFVAVSTWLTQARSTDWNNSLWVKVYPINADNSIAASEYIAGLDVGDFKGIEAFLARETERYGSLRDRLYRFFMDQGVFLRPLGNTIYLLPPFTISDEELSRIYASVSNCLEMLSDD